MRKKEREIKDLSEIEAVISDSDVCRVAFADGNIPYIVTMNFGYRKGKNSCLFFHCAPEGRKLDMLRKNNFVCFEMDTSHNLYRNDKACDWGMNFRSVIGYGRISIVEDEDERISGLSKIMEHYGGSGVFNFDQAVLKRTTILRLDIVEMTGKKR
jgi:uncharacterized protein